MLIISFIPQDPRLLLSLSLKNEIVTNAVTLIHHDVRVSLVKVLRAWKLHRCVIFCVVYTQKKDKDTVAEHIEVTERPVSEVRTKSLWESLRSTQKEETSAFNSSTLELQIFCMGKKKIFIHNQLHFDKTRRYLIQTSHLSTKELHTYTAFLSSDNNRTSA